MKKFIGIFSILIIVVLIVQTITTKDAKKSSTNSIGVSTFALYDITKHIVGDTQKLFIMMPFGVDIHSFEPTPQLIAKIQNSTLVIYNGAGLQHWIEDFNFKNKSIDMSKYVKLKKVQKHTHHEEDEHHHGAIDSHYWLDISNMIKMTQVITKELISISPKDKDFYTKNEQSYISMLEKLDNDFKTKLSECKKDTIIVNHNAFSYLSDRYGFHSVALSGLSPDAQPDAKTMIKLIKTVKEHNLSTVFFESFASDKAMKSIAKEAHVKVDVLQALGNITADEAKKDMSYEDIMRENLDKISKALECK
ncbi:MAG: metal ABC transporter substrate-binding protein [Campylobacterales bacterium]